MRVQLWSYNYDPEPTGIGPVSTVLAKGLRDSGYDVSVVAAHPHYPAPEWGTRVLPYRELRDGIPVTRLPLWIGRDTPGERIRQEASFAAALTAALPALGKPDAIISASPSFPALLPASRWTRLRRIPWLLWLHDILPDGAASTGLVDEGAVLRASRWLERSAYESADRIVVLSAAFQKNLESKGVPREKIELIYDPATRGVQTEPVAVPATDPPRVLCIGNIGFTQGFTEVVRAVDGSAEFGAMGLKLIATGGGQASSEAREAIRNGHVEMLGLVSDKELEQQLRSASLALVSQQPSGVEFNLPSKIMNYMGYGLPVVAFVDPGSEVARLIGESGAGWVADNRDPGALPELLIGALSDTDELARRGRAAHDYARRRFSVESFVAGFDESLSRLRSN